MSDAPESPPPDGTPPAPRADELADLRAPHASDVSAEPAKETPATPTEPSPATPTEPSPSATEPATAPEKSPASPSEKPSERLPKKVSIVPTAAAAPSAAAPPAASKLPPPPPPLPTAPAAPPPLPAPLPSKPAAPAAGPTKPAEPADDLRLDLQQQRLELAKERLELERLKLELAQLQSGVKQPTDKVRSMRPSDRAGRPTTRMAGEPARKGSQPMLLVAVGMLGAGAAIGGAIVLTTGGKKKPPTQTSDPTVVAPPKVDPQPKDDPADPPPKPKPTVPPELKAKISDVRARLSSLSPRAPADSRREGIERLQAALRTLRLAPSAELAQRELDELEADLEKALAAVPAETKPPPRPIPEQPPPPPPEPEPEPAPEPVRPTPRPRPDPTPQTGTKEPKPPATNDELTELFATALAHYTEKDAVRLGRVLTSMESIAPDAPETHAARGLFAELAGRFNEAASELQKAGGKGGWVTARALIHSLYATLRFEAAREVIPRLTERERDLWTTLIDGPFRKNYPLAADSCVANTPEGRYRVITDLGLPSGHLAKLEKKLQETPEGERAKKAAAAARSHKGLQELCDVMDKAYKAYGKLLATEEPSQVYPTVFVLQSRTDFDRFSASLEMGSVENALGYYVPSFRILVFYDQPEGRVPGRLLSQGTLNVLLHETFHQWLHLQVDGAPRWFDEGMAEYFGIGEMTSSGLRYGLVPTLHPSRLDNIREALTGALYEPLPLADMIRADRETFYGSRAAVNYAQAWSFVHYLGSSTKGQKLLREYFKSLRRGSDLETAFKEVFGAVDMAAMEKDWREYVGKLR